MMRVRQYFSQHLIASADSKNNRSPVCFFEDHIFQAGLTEPQEILNGIFASRKQDHIRISEFSRGFHITQ